MKYIKNIIKEKDIIDLFGLFNLNMQNQIKWYWGQLSQYEYFDKKFQKDIIKAIENSYFDYSLICVSIYQQEKREKFIKDLNACDNKEVKYLFHGTQIDPISHIITKGFLYPRKSFYGMGVYYSDMLDYISFYARNETFTSLKKNLGKVIPLGITFSLVGTIVFYNKDKKKVVYDNRYSEVLDHFPTYEEIRTKYPEEMNML